MDITSAQKLAWANKVTKGFNTTEIPLEFCLLQGEVAEAFHAWRHKHEHVGEELADIALYLFSLAEIIGINLEVEIEGKLIKNAQRSYRRDGRSGVLVKS